MQPSLERVRVFGLHKKFDVDIPISDNRIVLVGINGLGKTTIVNMIYFFLTKQWERLSAYKFDSMEVQLSGETLVLGREDLVGRGELRKALMKMAAQGDSDGMLSLMSQVMSGLPDDSPDRPWIDRMFTEIARSHRNGTPLPPPRMHMLLQRTHFWRARTSKKVQQISERLSAAKFRVLYMPTYRRIEQELEEIFPGMNEVAKEDFKSRVLERHARTGGHLELIEFGMRDVDESLDRVTAEIRDSSRRELNNLAGSYLRDVIRGEARKWDEQRIVDISEEQALAIVSRVEENTLLPDDRTKIIDAIGRAKVEPNLSDDDQLLVHFFWKLTQIFDSQKQLEAPLREFVKFCNRYLSGKRMLFDEVQITVRCMFPNGDVVKLRDLSSGEKQIVSLFAKLLLDAPERWWIIIDEPELSLSVAWQKLLLPDILSTGRCDFLAAVTHSPFIFDNELQVSTQDLSDLTKVIAE